MHRIEDLGTIQTLTPDSDAISASAVQPFTAAMAEGMGKKDLAWSLHQLQAAATTGSGSGLMPVDLGPAQHHLFSILRMEKDFLLAGVLPERYHLSVWKVKVGDWFW